MKKLAGIVFALALVVTANVAVIAPAHAETTTTTNVSSLMETLKSLMAKVEELYSNNFGIEEASPKFKGTMELPKETAAA